MRNYVLEAPTDMLKIYVYIHVLRPSETLLCSGVPEDIARNALRLSIGRNTSKEDIDDFIDDLKQAVKKLERVLK